MILVPAGILSTLAGVVVEKRLGVLVAVPVLLVVLALGRLYYFGAMLLLARWLQLPAVFVAGLSVVAGWPGVVLMLVTIPSIVAAARRQRPTAAGVPR